MFVKGLDDVLNGKELEFDQNDFKKQINLKARQVIELDPQLVRENKHNIKLLLSKKIQQKLEHNLHYSDGLLKVWNWSGFFDKKFELIFAKERGLYNEAKSSKSKEREVYLRRAMKFDICFLQKAISDYQKNNKGNHIQKY